MSYFHWIAGCALGLAWLWRLADAAVGVPKIADISQPEWDHEPPGDPRVSIIVPACNEAADIEATLVRLLALEYDNYEVVAVDDRSTDRTGEIMERIAAAAPPGRLKVIHIAQLPEGWMGKPHAMWSASNLASGDWLLFTDADVLFRRDVLRRALAYAEAERADHLVLFPRMIMKHPGEKMMIAFFQTLFVFGHRPWKVADSTTKDHIGVGAFNMIRRPVYDALGTYQALRFDVLDDMKLGKVVKNAGYAQRNVFGADLISIRWAKGAWGVVDNLTKNFFAIMSFQWPRALGVLRCPGLPEPHALRRNCAGPWLGASGIRGGPVLHVFDLCGNVTEVGYSAVLLRSASHQHSAICLHHAAFNVSDPGTRRRDVARHVLSAGRTKKTHGVGLALLGILRFLSNYVGRLLLAGLAFGLGMAERPRAVAALFFHVVALGQGRNSGAGAAELPVFFENDLCAPVILLDLAVNLDHPALQLPHVAYALQVTGKDHDGEWTDPVVVTEVKKMNSSRALLDSYNFARNAFDLAHVFPGFRKGKAIGPG